MPISAIDKKNLTELGASLALTAVTLPFVATPAGQITLITTTLGISCINALWRKWSSNHPLGRGGRAAAFAITDMATRELVTHELSHAATACALFQRAQPSIEIIPFVGGATDYASGHGLTRLGQMVGTKHAHTLVSGAGPACNLLFALGNVIAGHKFRRSHPELSTYCRISAIASIANNVLYALAALVVKTKQSGFDFAVLARAGLHPVAAAALLIATPIILQTGLWLRGV